MHENICIAGSLVTCLALHLASPRLGAQEDRLVVTGDAWKYMKGTEAPPDGWNQVDFDDTTWLEGPTGIGYGDNDDATVLDDMINNYLTVYARRGFSVPDRTRVSSLTLRITYDDGFVAYLNGEEVARSANMGLAGSPVDQNTAATPDHEVAGIESFPIDPGFLENGENVLAIEVHNTALTSSDLSLIPELIANADACPAGLTCVFTFGTGTLLRWTNFQVYDSITIERDGRPVIEGLDGATASYTDFDPPGGRVHYAVHAFLAGNECAALECDVDAFTQNDLLIAPGDEWRFFRGSQAPPPGWNAEVFDDSAWESGPTGIGYGDLDDMTVLDDMQTVADDPLTPEDEFVPGYLAVFCRKSFQPADPAAIGGLTLSVVFDDGFVAYLNGTEVGRAAVFDDPPTELTAATAAIEATTIEIDVPVSLLRAGTNVLAVSVHNAALTSTDLSFIPSLAKRGGGGEPSFQRGNSDGQGGINLTDAVAILRFLFQGGGDLRCPDAADADDNGAINLTDAVFILRFLFQGGGNPPPPGVDCGPDPTSDDLSPCTPTC